MCLFFIKMKKGGLSKYKRNSRYAIQGVAFVGLFSVIFYIYIIFNWLFFNKLRFELWVLVVVKLDLYEWRLGQKVLQNLFICDGLRANMSCKGSKIERI
jgi:hypothetical protein